MKRKLKSLIKAGDERDILVYANLPKKVSGYLIWFEFYHKRQVYTGKKWKTTSEYYICRDEEYY